MSTVDTIKQKYPLHFLVWNNDYMHLEQELAKNEHDRELRDPHNRTPLMLAVTLAHVESVRVLLNSDVNVNCETDGWTVVQEAVATGDPELLHMVLQRRDQQRSCSRAAGIPELLQRLEQAPDFYVEMKWEFTSWVPLVSRMCPSDTYKVYKQGSNVRIDTTLLGFDHANYWQRGSRSYVFKGGGAATLMMEVDHDTRQVYVERVSTSPLLLDMATGGTGTQLDEHAVSHRLTTPIVTTYVDTDKISFERNKAGVWGWRSDKTEMVNGYECKVFSASNVELVTKTRTEHLTESDKQRSRAPRTPLQSFLGIAETSTTTSTVTTGPDTTQAFSGALGATPRAVMQAPASVDTLPLLQQNEDTAPIDCGTPTEASYPPRGATSTQNNPCNITAEEYFDPLADLQGRDIGRAREVNTKIQKFKGTLWLSEQYPLSLQEQILPVVDLMAISSTHFAKLKDFIQMQLPSGFPVKIEIPLFHILNARITFGNIFGLESQSPDQTPDPGVEVRQTSGPVGVARVQDESGRVSCLVDESCFATPAGYAVMGGDEQIRRQFSVEEEDDLLQFAIEQSLIEAGTERDEVDIWEALKGQRPSTPNYQQQLVGEEERQLQRLVENNSPNNVRAIQASLALYRRSLDAGVETPSPDGDAELQMALLLSEQQRKEEEERRLQEQKMLEEILQLSLIDK